MSEKKLNILVIEDNENDYTLLLRALTKENLNVDALRVDTTEALVDAVENRAWDIVITDNNIPDRRINVESSMAMLRQKDPNIPFIIVSGTIVEDNAVNLVKRGVNDYILKSNITRLGVSIKRELAEAASRIEKKIAQQKLKESEERYRMLAGSIKDMFFALDQDLICTFWNKAAEAITKIPAEDAVGKLITDILPLSGQSAIADKFFDALRTMEACTLDIEYNEVNPPRYYQVTLYPSREMHSIMVKDITQAKNINRQLIQVNEELETFIYRVSHDIRGPLASIQGLINLARNENFSTEAGDFFSRISTMAGRLENVISGLQGVVRIKQESVEISTTSIMELLDKATVNNTDKPFELKLDLGNNVGDGMLTTDIRLLVIALENMISNSIEFCHPSRKPVVNVSFTKKDDDYYQIVLKDNGIGISDDVRENIFKMFYRGSVLSKGSGLGLYLAMSAVEKLGGSIDVKSTVDKGSAFSIRLPLIRNERPSVSQLLIPT